MVNQISLQPSLRLITGWNVPNCRESAPVGTRMVGLLLSGPGKPVGVGGAACGAKVGCLNRKTLDRKLIRESRKVTFLVSSPKTTFTWLLAIPSLETACSESAEAVFLVHNILTQTW